MHEKYNAVFSLYLFYEGTLYKEFNLSKMPTQYEQEWEENSSWLKLGFHAQRMHPAYPYQTASYQQAKDDFLAVKSQVLRFASEKSWDEMMCSHYWSGSLESCRAWRDLGIKGFYAAHQARQSYYLPKELSQFLNLLDFFYDAQEGNLFIQTDIWMERDFPTTPNLEHSTHQKLHALAQENPLGMHNIHLFTHESYLLPQNHFHKMREKLEAALSWLVSQGYKQEFDGENPFFNMLPPPAPFHLKKISQGENALLVWERREKEPCTYLLYKKTLSHPHGEPGEWLEMGKTNQQSWLLNAQEKEEWAAYKVAAVLGEKQSISNPFILEPEPLKEELTIKLYPNPFNQSATMQYSLPEAAEVSMSIYNLLGQRIRQFPRELQAAGHYWQEIDAENLASGIYIVELMAGKQRATKKMLLLK
ncbi:MAG: hypothetical protein A3D92_05705 [Bacteroidetes bacterium RIFCSPHIGHO2_02_FULL_44_7]|nr:MAG: hypothetical protein A3D92_05705 [Bacteroidetes bacterium RIFCSPHIGHO2_02_FULL_44_7]